ncbi:MAG: transketolase family protein, partial [Flavobacteriales bacterium]
LGEDGATHQILEDVGMMKMLPNMTVIHTCDYEQTRNATHAVAAHHGPVYFRFGRPKVPVITAADEPFVIGKARRVMTGSDVTLVTNGHIVWNSILAARELAADGISVDLIDMHTIKPLDEAALIESVSRTGCVVSAEEHQRFGGLGESVAACLAAHQPTPQRFVAVEDSFGESGTPAQLLEKYGLGPGAIAKACREAIAVKQGLPA